MIVEALTDNRNRTAADVRARLRQARRQPRRRPARSRGSSSGTGVVLVDADGVDEDELTLAAAEGGAEDVERDGSSFQVTLARRRICRAVREAIEGAGIAVESAELTMVPKTTVDRRRRERGEEDRCA